MASEPLLQCQYLWVYVFIIGIDEENVSSKLKLICLGCYSQEDKSLFAALPNSFAFVVMNLDLACLMLDD
ncbi:hypothetical protein AV530_016771 [Patagioenas fasciata monilis]|uniref:Uncharacterized protein n=1 Tax=Patagioenas fasciata monilis TaxID=372326 RepID=A0A1V4J4Q6_PATFA|nr:hypothetical protein AV530_016771 [Patagioenas fasciata monilis]